MIAQRVDASHAAAVLGANGSDLPTGITDTAGYIAYWHADLAAAWRWHAEWTTRPGRTLIAFGNVEGGWLLLYEIHSGAVT